jgi:putative peptidoglycan lipid II flippase
MTLPQLETDPGGSNRARIVQAATIVGAAYIVSRLLGLFRDVVINYLYGISSLEANAYFIANRFPETIFLIIAGGALGSAFIPVFSTYFVRDDAAGGWRVFSAILNLIVLVMTVISVIAMILTPQIITAFYSDLVADNPELLEMTIDLMRVMLITPIIFGASGVIMSALNARQHFLLPALAPVVYNLGIIAGAIALAPNVMGLAIGAVVGATGHLLIQLPGLRMKHAHYSPILSVRDAGVRQVMRLMAPRVLGLSFGQLNHVVIQFMAQSMVIGSIPAIGFAWRIMMMPHGIIGQALAVAAFPTFANLAARKEMDEMRRIVADTLRLIFFLSLPSALMMMLLRVPIVTVLFERGQFNSEDTQFVAWALLFYALSLIGLAAIEIISRAFYALEDTWTPVIAGFLQLIGMWLLGLWLGRNIFPAFGWLSLGGLALGFTISSFFELVLLLWLLRKKMGGINGRQVFSGVWRMVLACLVMGVVTWLVLQQLSSASVLWQLLAAALAGGITYLLASMVLGVTELRQLWGSVRRRVWGS